MKARLSNAFLIAYFIVAIVHLLSILVGEKWSVLELLTKPLLMPTLIGFFYVSTTDDHSAFRRMILFALIFSWVGDVVLLFQERDSNYFLIGLISFLAAHVCYIIGFTLTPVSSPKRLLKEKPWLALPFIAYGVLIFLIVRAGLDTMMAPVIIYEIIILTMGITALNRFRRVEFKSFMLVFTGAITFMVSDSLLAINKFARPFPSAGFLIMFTYIAAQLLIVDGSRRQLKGRREL